jgi:chromatin remodeling complex protein RSC6
VSQELLDFLGEPAGTPLARTAVVKRINDYIKQNALQTKGRFIDMKDDKLRHLLGAAETDEITYFSMCKRLSPHFIKAPKVETPAPPCDPAEAAPQPKRVRAK